MSSAYRGFVGCAPDLFCVCVFPFSLTLKRQTKCVFFGVWNEVGWLVRKSNTTNRTTYIGLCGRNSGSSGTLAERIFLVWHALPCRLCFFFFPSSFICMYVGCENWDLKRLAAVALFLFFFFSKLCLALFRLCKSGKKHGSFFVRVENGLRRRHPLGILNRRRTERKKESTLEPSKKKKGKTTWSISSIFF